MLKLIRADLYKTFRRAAYFIMLAAFSGLAAALVVMLRRSGDGTLPGAFSMAPELLEYPAALLPLVTQLTLGEEFRERTVKNAVEYGTGRTLYFVSKLISTVILGALLTAAVFGTYFGAAAMLLPRAGASARRWRRTFSAASARPLHCTWPPLPCPCSC